MRNEGSRVGEVKYYIILKTRRCYKLFTDQTSELAEEIIRRHIESSGYRLDAIQTRGHVAYFEVVTNDFSLSPASIVNQIRKCSGILIKEIPEMSHLPNIWQSGFFLSTKNPTKKELLDYIIYEE